MSEEQPADERVAALERQLAETQAAHRATLLRAGLRAEAARAGMVDMDGLKLVDASALQVDEHGEVAGAAALMTSLRRAKPWLFGAASGAAGGFSSSTATAPPAQPPKARRASDMTHDEWRIARAEMLRRL